MKFALSFLLLSLSASALAQAAAPAINFSPVGLTKTPKQARAVFPDAMVAMGDLNAESPFQINCAPKGSGRWEDTKTWVYEFATELGGGESCSFTLKPGTKNSKGKAVPAATFAFNTGGPGLLNVRPWEGSAVEEDQAFLLELDAEPNRDTLSGNFYFEVEGIPEKIPALLLEGDQLKKVMKASYLKPREGRSFLLAQPTRRLPENVNFQLVWGAGIKTKGGAENKEAERKSFRVREPFTAKFTCTRENADSPCNPIAASLGMEFTAPIKTSDARRIRLVQG